MQVLNNARSGLWVGQALETKENVPTGASRELRWVLSVTATAPSAFGGEAVLGEDGPNGCRPLTGDWDRGANQLRLRRLGGPDETVYTGRLKFDPVDSSWSITGTWLAAAAGGRPGAAGHFAARREPKLPGQTSGLWLGQADPAAELAAFAIPTNPIRWALAVVGGCAFGAGYFDDAGDVPGQPVLHFSLFGTLGEDGRLKITKEYEQAADQQGYRVEYAAALRFETEPDGRPRALLEGTWRNEAAGSHGRFQAWREPTLRIKQEQLQLCASCAAPIKTGEVRWECGDCRHAVGYEVCALCKRNAEVDATELHSHALLPAAVHESEQAHGRCSAELVLRAFDLFSERPFVAHRSLDDAAAGVPHKWLTYGDIKEEVCDLAVAIRALLHGQQPVSHSAGEPEPEPAEPEPELDEGTSADLRPRVLICLSPSVENVVVTLACIVSGTVLVPLPKNIDDEAMAHVFAKTLPAIAVVGSSIEATLQAAIRSSGYHPRVIICTHLTGGPSHCSTLQCPLKALLAEGKSQRQGAIVAPEIVELETTAAILFTSGSTGIPKGTVFSEDLVLPVAPPGPISPFVRLDFESYDPVYLLTLLGTLQNGGRRGIGSGVSFLLYDFKKIEPTHVGATPILWNLLHQDFVSQVASRMAAAPGGLAVKIAIEKEVGDDMRHSLGRRLHVASSGGAPITPEVLQWIKTYMRVDIANAYGTRETGGIACDGIIYPGIDVQLRSVAELGYYSTGAPPRGEICVHSPRLVSGYFNDASLNRENFISIDGKQYYTTGDVGEFYTDDDKRKLRVIDRCSFFFKLSQGEWVSPAKIEGCLEDSPWVRQAFVMGSSEHSRPVAVIVPSDRLYAQFPALEAEHEQLREQATSWILQKLQFWCRHQQLKAAETPQHVFVELVPWNSGSGLLTANFKKARTKLKMHYQQTCHAIWELHTEAVADHDRIGEALDVSLLRLVQRVLQVGDQVDPNCTLIDLGGSSLTAGALVTILHAETGVRVPIQALYEYPLCHIADMIAAGENAPQGSVVRAVVDWHAACQLPEMAPPAARSPGSPTGVFLTGATGFLGPVLLAELFAAYPDSIVTCLVRAPSVAVAETRLLRELTAAKVWAPDTALGPRVRAVPGDLANERFGLALVDWTELISSTSDVYHNGARVNHVLPFAALKAPNVSGTIEAINLAVAAGARLHFSSSVAATASGRVSPEDFLTLEPDQFDLRDGYGQTKMVAEQLLRSAHAAHGLPVNIFRLSVISGHTVSGYSNELDFGNMLILACVLLKAGVFQTSFALGWIAADDAARSMVRIGKEACNNGVYHLVRSFLGSEPQTIAAS
jgi:fatty acid CoA ligase FadD9